MLAVFSFLTINSLSGQVDQQDVGGRTININIQVAPSTISKSANGGRVTVQTDIKYSQVEKDTVQLNGLSPLGTKTNARGNLVAYFSIKDIKNFVFPPSALLELTGLTVNGDDFYGSDVVRVTQ
jgi:hypothetical protein